MAGTRARRWSQDVTRASRALDLEPGLFTAEDPRRIARALKRSAEASRRRKTDPFRSALSMLTFYINRAGTRLTRPHRRRLEAAKDELRELFGRPRHRRGHRRARAEAPAARALPQPGAGVASTTSRHGPHGNG